MELRYAFGGCLAELVRPAIVNLVIEDIVDDGGVLDGRAAGVVGVVGKDGDDFSYLVSWVGDAGGAGV